MLRRSKKMGFPVCEVKYETLTKDPEGTMRALLNRLSMPWHPAVLQHHQSHHGQVTGGTLAHRAVDRQSAERWRTVLAKTEILIVDSLVEQ